MKPSEEGVKVRLTQEDKNGKKLIVHKSEMKQETFRVVKRIQNGW